MIYVAVGYHVFHHRNLLRNLTVPIPTRNKRANSGGTSEAGDSAEEVRISVDHLGRHSRHTDYLFRASRGDKITMALQPPKSK